MAEDSAGKLRSFLGSRDRRTLTFAAWPLADETLSQEILDILQQATQVKQSKKGANEGL